MKKTLIACTASVAMLSSLLSMAGDAEQMSLQRNAPGADGGAFTESSAAPIKSPSDLVFHLKGHPGDSPLMVLSPLTRQLFLAGLRFNEKGVTTLRYDVLESLTPSEAYQILSLFGMQGLTPRLNLRGVGPLDNKVMAIAPSLFPLKDYYCEGRGTCRQGDNVACSDAC